MRIVEVNCNNCGAPLEVSKRARFVTCGFCKSKLKIGHTDTSSFTEALEDIRSELGKIRRQNDIETLDREWMQQRESSVRHHRNGQTGVPSVAAGVGMMIFTVTVGVIWMSFAISMGAPGPFPLFGLVFAAFGVVTGLTVISRGKSYQRQASQYRRKRREMMRAPTGHGETS